MPITFDIAKTGVQIRAAEPADAKAVRMLLPDVPADDRGGVRLVAVDRANQLVVGAAAALGVMRPKPPPGPGVAVHVIPPCRGHGVGKALVHELAEQCARGRAQALYSIRRVDVSSPEMAAWQSLRFFPCETAEEHELVIADVEARLTPVIERLRQEGRIPSSAHIVPLYAADADAVVTLHLKNLGGDRDNLLARVRGQSGAAGVAAGAFHPRYSLVLMLGGGVVGCLLGHRSSQRDFVIDAVIVDPALRNGWANLWLKLEAARRVRPTGGTHIHYTTFDHYVDTRRFTQKLGGVTTRRLALMCRPIR